MNESTKICGRQSFKDFTWPILEYFVPNTTKDAAFKLQSQVSLL